MTIIECEHSETYQYGYQKAETDGSYHANAYSVPPRFDTDQEHADWHAGYTDYRSLGASAGSQSHYECLAAQERADADTDSTDLAELDPRLDQMLSEAIEMGQQAAALQRRADGLLTDRTALIRQLASEPGISRTQLARTLDISRTRLYQLID